MANSTQAEPTWCVKCEIPGTVRLPVVCCEEHGELGCLYVCGQCGYKSMVLASGGQAP